jgi:parvulin-like peptidyl-prolyl isomerase
MLGLTASLGLMVAVAGCGGPKVVARVNNETITEKDFYDRVLQVDAMELGASAQMRGPALAGEFAMQALLTEKVVLQLAAQKGATPTDAQIAGYMAFAKRFPQALGPGAQNPFRSEAAARRDARIQVALRNLTAKPLNITDAELQDEYNRAKDRLVEPRQYHLRLIEVGSETKAKEALAQLAKGISFETVALTQSEDPVAKARSGDVGYLPEPTIPPALLSAIKMLKPGEYSKQIVKVDAPPPGAPNQRRAGPHFFVAQLVEVKEPRQIPFEEVRYGVENVVINRKDPNAGQRISVLLRDFMKGAQVEVTLKGYEDVAKKLKEGAQGPIGAPVTPPVPAPPK